MSRIPLLVDGDLLATHMHYPQEQVNEISLIKRPDRWIVALERRDLAPRDRKPPVTSVTPSVYRTLASRRDTRSPTAKGTR